ncbi:MAG: HDOD domain-containing protein, partial [Pseudomonas sp.]|uniref:HDOD domain-containing protein n=1 Tax=Pseudomonas sp. TaxID=306 RepID=UPI003390D679
MATAKPSPRTLDAWLKLLDGVRLPVPNSQHERLRHALGNSRNSMRDITELMQDSPAVALSVMREVNRKTGGLSEPAESLEVALTRLGLKRAEELLARLPAVDPDSISPALRQLQLISQHASQQANGLFGARLARLWQEIHWSSLLFLAPLWPLVASQPELFSAWEERVLANGETATKVERELLGVPLLKLCLALAEQWHFPEWIIQGYRLLNDDRRLLVKALHIARDNEHPLHQQQLLDDDPPLRRWLTQPSNTVLLANGLALSAHHAWDSPHSLRWQRLTGLYLHLPLAEVQQLIHQQAAQSARQHACGGLWHPAEALLWPWSARRLQATEATTPAPPPVTLSAWRSQCAQLLQEPSAFANVLQLTLCARDAVQACGFSRCLILLADRAQSRLQAQQALGLPVQAARLALDPAQSQVLRHLLKQPTQLRLTPANIAQYSALLPGSLKALFPGEHLLLRSLAGQERVVMLLIADQEGAPL